MIRSVRFSAFYSKEKRIIIRLLTNLPYAFAAGSFPAAKVDKSKRSFCYFLSLVSVVIFARNSSSDIVVVWAVSLFLIETVPSSTSFCPMMTM